MKQVDECGTHELASLGGVSTNVEAVSGLGVGVVSDLSFFAQLATLLGV